MNSRTASRTNLRKPGFESLEARRLLAVLFSENFDPIQPANFESIAGGRVSGARTPLQFNDGNTLYFDGRGPRIATTNPISISSGTLSFRLRLGAGFYPFEDIDFETEQVAVEYLTPKDNTWKLLEEYASNEPRFASADVWDLATYTLPPMPHRTRPSSVGVKAKIVVQDSTIGESTTYWLKASRTSSWISDQLFVRRPLIKPS